MLSRIRGSSNLFFEVLLFFGLVIVIIFFTIRYYEQIQLKMKVAQVADYAESVITTINNLKELTGSYSDSDITAENVLQKLSGVSVPFQVQFTRYDGQASSYKVIFAGKMPDNCCPLVIEKLLADTKTSKIVQPQCLDGGFTFTYDSTQ